MRHVYGALLVAMLVVCEPLLHGDRNRGLALPRTSKKPGAHTSTHKATMPLPKKPTNTTQTCTQVIWHTTHTSTYTYFLVQAVASFSLSLFRNYLYRLTHDHQQPMQPNYPAVCTVRKAVMPGWLHGSSCTCGSYVDELERSHAQASRRDRPDAVTCMFHGWVQLSCTFASFPL